MHILPLLHPLQRWYRKQIEKYCKRGKLFLYQSRDLLETLQVGCTYGRGGETGSATTGVRTVPSGRDWPGKYSQGRLKSLCLHETFDFTEIAIWGRMCTGLRRGGAALTCWSWLCVAESWGRRNETCPFQVCTMFLPKPAAIPLVLLLLTGESLILPFSVRNEDGLSIYSSFI